MPQQQEALVKSLTLTVSNKSPPIVFPPQLNTNPPAAFTNAKAAKDVAGMTAALIYRISPNLSVADV
jgi:hypothetical protein